MVARQANVAWALGKLSHHHQGLLDAMAQQATLMVKVSHTSLLPPGVNCLDPDTCRAAAAFAVTQHMPLLLPQCERCVSTKRHSRHLDKRGDLLVPSGCWVVLQAAVWGVQELSLQHISNILWAYASFLCVGRPMAAAFLQELRSRLRTAAFNAQQASNLLWSLCIAGVGAPHPKLC